MKIYTEITMQWDDNKGRLVEVSSESYEYKGNIISCKSVVKGFGRGIGNLGRSIGHDLGWRKGGFGMRAKDFSPTHMRGQMRGGKLPTTAPGHTFTEFIGKGLGGKEKYGKSGAESWKKQWYDPTFESFARAPIAGLMGTGSKGTGAYTEGGAGIAPERMSKFVSAGDVLTQAGLSDVADTLLGGVQGMNLSEHASQGYGGPLITKNLETSLIGKGQDLSEREREFGIEEERIATELTDAEAAKRDAILENQIKRAEQLAGRLPEAEKAKAIEAKTGMAYSAPAQQQVDLLSAEKEMDLVDIARSDKDIVDALRGRREELAGEQVQAEDLIKSQRGQFGTDFKSILGETGAEIGEIQAQAAQLPAAWKQFGQDKFAYLKDWEGRDPIGQTQGGGGYDTASKYFKETESQIPEIEELARLGVEVENIAAGLGDEAMRFYSPDEGTGM